MWLQAVLEENRRVVAGWPQWKRGAGMSDEMSEAETLVAEVGRLRAENAKLKANREKANEELCDLMGAIDKLKAALEGIVKIRFLLGNDPKLNPAYEMGDIAQQALKEASCESTSQSR